MAITNEPARPYALESPPPPGPGASAATPAVLVTLIAALAAIVVANVLDPVYVLRQAEVAAVLAGAALAVAAAPRRAAPWLLAALVSAWLVLYVLYLAVKGLDYGLPVARTVGGGAYSDSGYFPTQVVSLFALALAFVLAFVLRLRYGAVAPAATPVAAAAPGGRTRGLLRRPAAPVAGATALLALTLQPDLWASLRGPGIGPVAPQWDLGNGLAWQFFLERGLEPVKDFFFPYGHLLAFTATPWGPMWRWFAYCFLLGVTAWAFWRLTDRSRARTIVVVAAVTVFLYGWSGVLDRYFDALLVAIVYAAIGPLRSSRPTFGHLLMGLVALYATWLEPDVLLIAVAGMAFIVAGELVSGRVRLAPRTLLRRLAVDAAPLALVVLVPLTWLQEGSWSENWRFWLNLRVSSNTWAPDQHAFGALLHQELAPTSAMLGVMLPVVLLIAGLALGRLGRREEHAASMLVLIGAAACQVMLLKSLVRNASDNVVLFGFVMLVLAGIVLWNPRSVRLAAVVGVLAGAAFITLQQPRIVTNYVRSAVDAPAHIVSSVKLHGEYAQVSAGERARFAPSRFKAWPEYAMAGPLRAAMASSPNKTFAVLGDAALLYLLFDQPPPYHVELYNAARIDEERAYIDELERDRTEFIVYRRDVFQDAVPQDVRVPLIFDYVIRNYVPVSKSDTFDILKRRDGQPIPVDYWRSRLDTLDLGFVPMHSSAAGDASCTGGAGCVPYAILRGHTSKSLQPVLLRVTAADGTAFGAVVNTKAGHDTYAVRLDRLWFSPLVGPDPRVTVQVPASGWNVQVQGRRAGDDLY
jgi:hypothetical protein